MFARLLPLCVLFASTVAMAGTPKVSIVPQGDQLVVTIGGKPFAVYNDNVAGKLPKPFFSPVRGPGGTILTRRIAGKGDDHPHHKGIWIAVDEVNGVRFWAEKGRITTEKVGLPRLEATSDGSAEFKVINKWKGPDGKTVVEESTKIRIFPNRVIAYRISFYAAGKKPVTFRDTKEGLLGFRMVNSMREKEGGSVVNSEGKKGSAACWGRPAKWIDYYGKVDGKTFGVAIFDHPGNFRPSRYHVRNYGLFSISPFGRKAYTRGKQTAQPVTIKPGESLRLRYAIYIHAGDTKSAKVAEVYKKYVKSPK